ncbi:MAG TPA: Clp protease ClpP [Candidatus Competibacter sp.]|nr:Clp protease ClpP [Candidatus Competibacter sp.]
MPNERPQLFRVRRNHPETARALGEFLRSRPTAAVTVHVNSYGGDLAAGLAMLNALRAHRGDVRVEVEGIAASSATLLPCAGHAAMANTASLMVHAPWCDASGSARALRNAAEGLDTMMQGMIAAYCAKTGKPPAAIAPLLEDGQDHWFTPAEALAFGLIDEITPGRRIAARLGQLQPPARCRELMTQPATPPTDAEIVHIQDAAAREALAREQNRRRDIKNLLVGPLARQPELLEVQAMCLDDPNITVEQASKLLLKKQGEGVVSIGGWNAVSPTGGADAVTASIVMPHGPLAREFYAAERAIRSPVGFGGFGHREFISAASDALAIKWGARLEKVHPAAQDLKGSGLVDLASMILSASGQNPVGMSRAAIVKAVMTTSDFPNLLADSANKVLSTRMVQIALEHRALAERGTLTDFKPSKIADLSSLPGLVRKYEGGEITYGAISDSGMDYTLSTYAIGLAFTREAMINDDQDGIGQLLRNSATSGARLERDLIFALLASNPAMSDGKPLFHADHGNLDTGGKGVTIEGLNAARVLMRRQKDSNGGYVLTAPRFLVVPVGHEGEAEALVASMTYRPGTSTEIQTPEWVRGLVVVSDPRLDDQDPDDWYLLSDPAVAPAVRIGYLNGRDTPETEEKVDFNTDVIHFKIRFDVAVAAVGWAGAVKMA